MALPSGGAPLPSVKAPAPAKLSAAAFNQRFNARFNQKFSAGRAGKVGGPKAARPARAPRAAAPSANAASNPLLNPNATLSGPGLLQAAQALATSATAPAIAAYEQQIAQNNAQTKGVLGQVGGFYNQLGQLANQGVTAEGNIGSGLNSQLQQIGQQEQGQLGQIGQNATQSLLKYAPQSDQSHSLADPALQALSTEIARQQGLAAQDQGAFRSFGAQQGANANTLAASNLGVDALAGTEGLRSIALANTTKNEPLMARLALAQATRGADVESALGRLRQQEIVNNISRAGLGIRQLGAQAALQNAQAHSTSAAASAQNARTNVFKANSTARSQAFQNNPAAVGSRAWANVQNVRTRGWSSNPNAVGSPAWARVRSRGGGGGGGGGGSKPLTTLENNAWLQKFGTVQQLIKDGHAHGINGNQIRLNLSDGKNPSRVRYDQTMITAAFELMGYGAIQPQTAQQLRGAYGVRLPSNVRVGKVPSNLANWATPVLNFHF